LFDIVKFIGAAYLIYIGYQLLSSKNSSFETKELTKVSYKKMFMQGAITNIMNPKIAIFYFAYLPQFILVNNGSDSSQLFLLGLTFAILTLLLKASIGFISGLLSFWIKERPTVLKYMHKTSGAILIGLGLKLATEQKV